MEARHDQKKHPKKLDECDCVFHGPASCWAWEDFSYGLILPIGELDNRRNADHT